MTEKETTDNSSFTCPNSVCKKVFAKPLKTVNRQVTPEKFYDACPYCLTEVTAADKKTAESSRAAVSGCAHYLGYLNERATKGDVPDECILCKNLLSCMLEKKKH